MHSVCTQGHTGGQYGATSGAGGVFFGASVGLGLCACRDVAGEAGSPHPCLCADPPHGPHCHTCPCVPRPMLIDMNKVYRQTNLENLDQAFSVAERDLGVTRLLDPEGACHRPFSLGPACPFAALPLTPALLLQREMQRHPAQRDGVAQVLPGAGGEADRPRPLPARSHPAGAQPGVCAPAGHPLTPSLGRAGAKAARPRKGS